MLKVLALGLTVGYSSVIGSATNQDSTMNTSTHTSLTMQQITVSVEGFKAKVLLTRFNGSRLWAARGSIDGGNFDIVLHDGIARQSFQKATALRLAELFIRTGREFL
jgi:hypothetical protein